MKFETSPSQETPFHVARDAEARAAAYLDSARVVRPEAGNLVDLIQAGVRSYPLSALGVAFVGGALVATALRHRDSGSAEASYHRGRHLLYAALVAVAQALRDRSTAARSAVRKAL